MCLVLLNGAVMTLVEILILVMKRGQSWPMMAAIAILYRSTRSVRYKLYKLIYKSQFKPFPVTYYDFDLSFLTILIDLSSSLKIKVLELLELLKL